MAANAPSHGVVKQTRGSYDLHTLRWTVSIQDMPANTSKSSEFASYSAPAGEYTLKLALQLVTSASAKGLSWKKVWFYLELGTTTVDLDVMENAEAAKGGDVVRRPRTTTTDVEVQLMCGRGVYAKPTLKRSIWAGTERWTFTPELDSKPDSVTIQVRLSKVLPKPTSASAAIFSLVLQTIDGQRSNDVVFIVASSPDRPLYANKSSLSAACPYFKAMFESGFQESKSSDAHAGACEDEEPSVSSSNPKRAEEASHFSVDRSGEVSPVSKKRKVLEGRDEKAASHCTRILIEDTTYEAFRAFLVYLATGDIYFEPLPSQIGQAAFTAFHAKYELENRGKAKPVSPLAMYRLAHRYELGDLGARSLVQLDRSLLSSSLVREAFTEDCDLCPEIKNVVHKRIATNWSTIHKSKEWIGVMKQMEAGTLPFAPKLLPSLMLRLAQEPPKTSYNYYY